MSEPVPAELADAIAVIGLAVRAPGAVNAAALWRLVRAGEVATSRWSRDDLLRDGWSAGDLDRPEFVHASGALPDVEMFDAAFFDCPPAEAARMDPQHRFFLECAWEALEDAGLDPARVSGRVGVFGGCGSSGYGLSLIAEGLASPANLLSLSVGTVSDFLPMRVSYKLGLRGPSVAIQTACSTSLVAVHVAALHLLAGQCEVALAGGVTLRTFQRGGYLYEDGSILSPDGICAPFDADARGTLEGDGVGIVVLKRFEDAWRDRDHIRAVLRGTAINNDGAAKVGFLAPSVEGQAAVIRDALAMAGVAPDTITYIEGHGTATPMGDPIELAALAQVFGGGHATRRVLGSIKGNIGHLDTAAGVVGLIKTVLALEHRELPPTANFRRPNPRSELARGDFQVLTSSAPWEAAGGPRRAGVSSFGMGGTNAHAIVEEAPLPPARAEAAAPQLLLVSARTARAVDQAAHGLAAHLTDHPELDLRDVAFTLRRGRHAFPYRRAVVSPDRDAAARELAQASVPGHGPIARTDRPIVFAFSGQGAQHPGMGRGLYQTEPVFRAAVDRCAEQLVPQLGCDLRSILFAAGASVAAETLAQTRWTQPALFVLEYALADLLESWGIRPRAFIGHSLGEYVAACRGGVFGLEDALALVAQRGALMQSMPAGAMLAVALPSAELELLLPVGVVLAAINGASRSVASGVPAAVAALEEALIARGVAVARLATSHAFHSPMMDAILAPFEAAVRAVRCEPPRIPVISNVTGAWHDREVAPEPRYWSSQLRHTVQFARGIATVVETFDAPIVLELGPGSTLTRFVRSELCTRTVVDAIAVLGGERAVEHEQVQALRAVGAMWALGGEVELAFPADAEARRTSLPTYPFERERHWIGGSPRDATARAPMSTSQIVAGSPSDAPIARQIEEIFTSLLGRADISAADSFFELGGDSLMGIQLVARLRSQLGATLTLADVFRAPTIADIVRLIGAGEASDGATPDAVPPEPALPAGTLPLTCAQEGLWIVEQLAPGTSVHHLTHVLELRGPLDVDALERALRRTVQRHEPLRTGFEIEDGRPVAKVAPEVAFELERASTAAFEPAAARRVALDQARQAAALPFDLRRPPLMRAMLVAIAADEHLFALTFHHLVADGWSFGVLVRELARSYAHSDDRSSRLAPYSAYALEERAWLATPEASAAREFWAAHLAALAPLELPFDRPRGAGGEVVGATHAFELSADTRRSIEVLAHSENTTPFVILLAAFATVLGRMADVSDLAVGVPLANRERSDLEPLIGMFVNTVVYRLRPSAADTARQLIHRVRDQHFEVLERQRYPFEKVVEAVRPLRELSWNPLFQVMFSFEGEALDTLALGPLEIANVELPQETSQFDLALSIAPRGDRYNARIQYSSMFDQSTIARIEGRLHTVLAAFAEDSRRPLGAIAIEPDPPAEIVPPVTTSAALDPSTIAPTVDHATRAFASIGLPPECVIGIAGEPSTELLRAALATLAAGRTLAFTDAVAPAAALGGAWPSGARIEHVPIDAIVELGAQEPPPVPSLASAVASSYDGPAVAWLRSGRELIAHAGAVARALELRPDDHVLSLLPLEAALACVALPAAAIGARFSAGTADSWGDTLAVVDERRATIAIATIERWNRWSDELARGALGRVPPTLRAIVSFGRRPSAARAAHFLKRTRGLMTWIHVVDIDHWPIATLASADDALSPAARRLAHLRWEVRNRDGLRTPTQSIGALYASGFGAPAGAAATGDAPIATGYRARLLADGGIDVLGSQHRVIEIGSLSLSLDAVEEAVAALPGVAEVAAMSNPDADSAPLAFVVPLAGRVISAAELRRQLSMRVPAHMVPECHVVSSPPRRASGELDVSALLRERAATSRVLETPRDDVEQILIDLWQRVLRVEIASVHDNVFSLGADSLLVVRFVSEAERRGLRISIRDVFQHQSVALLRRVVAAEAAPAVAESTSTAPEIALTPTQSRILGALGAPSRYNRSLLVALAEPLDRDAFRTALMCLVETHEVLRVRFARESERWIQQVVPQIDLPLLRLSAGELPGGTPAERLAAATERVQAGIRIDRAAPWAVAEIDVGDGRSRLFFVFHALVIDAVSWSTVLGDLEFVYRQARAGTPPNLPKPRVAWSRATEAIVALAREFESDVGRDVLPALARSAPTLPTDASGSNDEASQRIVERGLSSHDTARFLAKSERSSGGEALLATALTRTLAAWSGTKDVLLALGRHGRPAFADIDLARTVGVLVTETPVWLGTTDDAQADLERVAEELRALVHGGIARAWLREHATSAALRDALAQSAQPQVSLDYLGQPLHDASQQFAPSLELFAPDRAPGLPRNRIFHVIAHIESGALRIEWRYSANLHRAATVEVLADKFAEELRGLLRPRALPRDMDLR